MHVIDYRLPGGGQEPCLLHTIMRTRTTDTRLSLPGEWLNLYGVTATSLANRYFRPTGQWHTGIGTVHYARTPQCVSAGQLGTYSLIYDDDASAPSKFNTCYHAKEAWDCPLVEFKCTGQLFVAPNSFGSTVYTSVRVGAKDACAYALDSVPFMATDEQMLSEALSTCQPDIVRASLNVAQEVGEMLESLHMVKNLVKGATRILDAFDGRARHSSSVAVKPDGSMPTGLIWVPAVKRFLKDRAIEKLSIRDWINLLVSLDLGYKFAVKPFVSLMNKIVSVEERVHGILNRFTGEVADLHGVSTRSTSVSYTSTADPYHKWGNLRTYQKRVNATVRVRYSSVSSDRLKADIQRALTGRTLKHLPAAAWELLPLSFLVDYVVDFGSVLKQLALEPIADVRFEILQSGWSYKTTSTSEGWIQPFASGTYVDHTRLGTDRLVTGRVTKTAYYRRPSVLNLASYVAKPPEMHWPSMAQLFTFLEVCYAIKSGHREFIRVASPLGSK